MAYSVRNKGTNQDPAPTAAVNITSYADTGTQPGSGAQLLRDGSTYYDRATTEVTNQQRVDITDQIIRYHQLYGGSDNTQQGQLAASKALNYAKAPTMQQAQRLRITSFPFTFDFKGAVGLFGAENAYVRIDLDLDILTSPEIEEDDYKPAYIDYVNVPPEGGYEQEDLIYDQDPPPPNNTEANNARNVCAGYVTEIINGIPQLEYNCFMGALITAGRAPIDNPKVSVVADDIGTGNIYIDNWFEIMLYTRDQKMWGYDKMYVNPRDHFYLGFHARNTRQLPYNVSCTVGDEYISSQAIADKSLIATSNY